MCLNITSRVIFQMFKAEKIISYFRNPEVRYIIQIPYPNDTDVEILGYEFQAMPTLIPFLDMESQAISQSIKDILNRR